MRDYVDERIDEERDAEVLDRLTRAMSDSLRVRLLVAVGERPGVSIRQIAARVGEPERKVRYHVEALHSDGLLEVSEQVRRRGAVERRYRATTDSTLSTADERRTVPGRVRRIALETLKLIMSDATVAVAAARFGGREGHCEIRFHGEVDEVGWDELVEIHLKAMEEARGVFERSAERRAAGGPPGVEVTSATLLFEAPVWGED